MNKQTMQFAVQTDKNNIVQRVGKSSILQPKINYINRPMKWVDDSKYLKKK